jgi:hypothetical protein
VINAAGRVQGGVTFEISKPAAGATIDHHADVIWFANWGIFLPPAQESQATTHCTVPYAVDVFGLMSHTHQLGTHFSIEKWTPGGTEHVYDSTTGHPLYQEHSPPLVAEGEGLEWTCTWNNNAVDRHASRRTHDDVHDVRLRVPARGLAGDPIQCNTARS